MKERKCKFRKDKNSKWKDGFFHGFKEVMNTDCEYNETFFQDTLVVIEAEDGSLHNFDFFGWKNNIILDKIE